MPARKSWLFVAGLLISLSVIASADGDMHKNYPGKLSLLYLFIFYFILKLLLSGLHPADLPL